MCALCGRTLYMAEYTVIHEQVIHIIQKTINLYLQEGKKILFIELILNNISITDMEKRKTW